MKKYSLEGVDGNAYAIMGYVSRAMKETGCTKEEIDKVMTEAQSMDYGHLLFICADMVDELNKAQVADELRKYIVENVNLADWELGQGMECIGRREPLPQNIKDVIDDCIADFDSDHEDDEDYAEFIDPWEMPEDCDYENFFYAIRDSRSDNK